MASSQLRQLLGSSPLTNTKSLRSIADLSCVYRHKPVYALREPFASDVSDLLCPDGLQTMIMRPRFLEARQTCIRRPLCLALVVEHRRVASASLLPRSYTNLNALSTIKRFTHTLIKDTNIHKQSAVHFFGLSSRIQRQPLDTVRSPDFSPSRCVSARMCKRKSIYHEGCNHDRDICKPCALMLKRPNQQRCDPDDENFDGLYVYAGQRGSRYVTD